MIIRGIIGNICSGIYFYWYCDGGKSVFYVCCYFGIDYWDCGGGIIIIGIGG